jgi:sigma-B regulation protein RsbU (phosphoserine phosphatase)
MKKRWGINRKTLTGIIVFTLLMVMLLGLGGSILFDRVIEKQYNDMGYVVANIILNDIDHDKIAEYAVTWQEDDYYKEMAEYLHHVEEYTGAAYIYIMVPYEDKTMRYIYDTATFIGDTDPISASFDEIWEAYTLGKKPESYLTRHSKKYGFLTSSCLPVKDSSGKVVALLFVDTNMDVILSTIRAYIFNMLVISMILLALFCLLNWKFIRKNLIKPMVMIRDNVRNFARNSEEASDALDQIKTGDELEDLARSVSHMEKEIVDYIDDIKKITAEKERIGVELGLATRIQAAMLPHSFPPFPDRHEFDIFATMEPAREVGGDFYDFFLIDEDHLGIVMADVSGKGIPAALFMMISKTILQSCAMLGRSAAETLMKTNEAICSNNQTEMFVTVWFGILEISTGRMSCSNAGHEYPAIRRAGEKFELFKDKHGLVIGGMDGTRYREYTLELKPGDKLFLYTDGIPEAMDADNKMYGTDRMINALNNNPGATFEDLIHIVRADVGDFVKDAEQFDDMTMLCLEYKGAAKEI